MCMCAHNSHPISLTASFITNSSQDCNSLNNRAVHSVALFDSHTDQHTGWAKKSDTSRTLHYIV